MIKEINCPKCKYELYPLDRVCDRCGTRIAASSSNATGTVSPKNTSGTVSKNKQEGTTKKASNTAPDNDKSDTIKKIAIISGIVLASLIGIAIIIFVAVMAAGALKNSGAADSESGSEVAYAGSVTIPEDLLYEIGLDEEYLNKAVSTGLAKSATTNEDGSVTLEMSELQHKAAIELIKKQINRTLKDYVDDEYYYGVLKITANSDYTSYDILTEYNSLAEYDDSLSYDLFTLSSSYATCIGKELSSIHINLIEKKTNKTYESFDYTGEDDEEDEDFDEDLDEDDASEAEDYDDVDSEEYEDEESYAEEYDEDDEYDDDEDDDEWEDATPDYDDDYDDDDDEYSEDGGFFVAE